MPKYEKSDMFPLFNYLLIQKCSPQQGGFFFLTLIYKKDGQDIVKEEKMGEKWREKRAPNLEVVEGSMT
jgi:hypothetical protein